VAVKKPKLNVDRAADHMLGRARFLRGEGSQLSPAPSKSSFDSQGAAGEPGTRMVAALQRKRRPAPWR
jgi:hypothetical protein